MGVAAMTPQRGPVVPLADDHTSPSVPGHGNSPEPTEGREWVVPLHWMDSPELRDNDRMHWAAEAKIVKRLRRDAAAIARSRRLPVGLHRVRIVLHWQPNVRRGRDQLSIAPTLKPLVDGLVDFGLVPDDTIEHVELSCVIEPVAKPARVWLHITDLGAPQ